MTRTRCLVLKISVRNKWQFTLIRKKLTPRAGIIQWCLNKLEDGKLDRNNKKKLNKGKEEVVQNSTEDVFLSGREVRGQSECVCSAQPNIPSVNPIPGVPASSCYSCELHRLSPSGADTAIEEKYNKHAVV